MEPENQTWIKMRRANQQLSQEKVEKVLKKISTGVLGLFGENGYPYTVPISFVYENNKFYFHSAKKGKKIECIEKNCKCSFCVIDQDKVVKEKYTNYYRSVIAYGRMKFIEDENEKKEIFIKFALKCFPEDTEEHRNKTIIGEMNAATVMCMEVDYMTGKQALELVRK